MRVRVRALCTYPLCIHHILPPFLSLSLSQMVHACLAGDHGRMSTQRMTSHGGSEDTRDLHTNALVNVLRVHLLLLRLVSGAAGDTRCKEGRGKVETTTDSGAIITAPL